MCECECVCKHATEKREHGVEKMNNTDNVFLSSVSTFSLSVSFASVADYVDLNYEPYEEVSMHFLQFYWECKLNDKQEKDGTKKIDRE